MSVTTTTEARPDEQKSDLREFDPEVVKLVKKILSLSPEAQSTVRRLLVRLRNRGDFVKTTPLNQRRAKKAEAAKKMLKTPKSSLPAKKAPKKGK